MSRLKPLRGACNCGRNQYSVVVPQDSIDQALIYFDDSSDSRRSQASLLTAWLRVPLNWYSSSTQAFFPDETHSSIRRNFTPMHAPASRRIFCGYCGTHLSLWTEEPPSEADFMNVTLGSLLGDDMQALQELGLLPDEVNSKDDRPAESSDDQALQRQLQNPPLSRTTRIGRTAGLDWFEEMLAGSRVGRSQNTRRGVGVSRDGSTTVEWEISEYLDNGGADEAEGQTPTGAKRKLQDVSEHDVKMSE